MIDSDRVWTVIERVLTYIAEGLIIAHYLPRMPFWTRFAASMQRLRARWEGHRIPAVAYSLRHEIAPIGAAGLLLNLVGSEVTFKYPNILYLDMPGTAAVALLLGPWWGAIVGVFTNLLISRLHPENAAKDVLPWLVVNAAGGVFWGLLGRSHRFRDYVNTSPNNTWAIARAHLSYLFWFGLVAAIITGAVGAVVELTVHYDVTTFARDSDFAFKMWQLRGHALSLVDGSGMAEPILRGILRWGFTAFRYIPDKLFSAALGLLIVKYAFPLFETTLIGDKKPNNGLRDNWLTPALALICVACVAMFSMAGSGEKADIWLWLGTLIALAVACVFEFFFGTDSISLVNERSSRVRSYLAAKAQLQEKEFFGSLVVAVLLSTLVFMGGLYFIKPKERVYVIDRSALIEKIKSEYADELKVDVKLGRLQTWLKSGGVVEAREGGDVTESLAFRFSLSILAYFLVFYLVRIGRQQWMAELSRSRYLRSGRAIENDNTYDAKSEPPQ